MPDPVIDFKAKLGLVNVFISDVPLPTLLTLNTVFNVTLLKLVVKDKPIPATKVFNLNSFCDTNPKEAPSPKLLTEVIPKGS